MPRRALQDILPVLPAERRQAPAAESWDALLVADEPAALAAAVAPGRLMQLRCLHWPSVPFKVEQYCRTACPALALNPSAEDVARRRLPPACDPAAQLDAPLLAEVAGAARWEARPAEAPRPAVVHIAEKFKQVRGMLREPVAVLPRAFRGAAAGLLGCAALECRTPRPICMHARRPLHPCWPGRRPTSTESGGSKHGRSGSGSSSGGARSGSAARQTGS